MQPVRHARRCSWCAIECDLRSACADPCPIVQRPRRRGAASGDRSPTGAHRSASVARIGPASAACDLLKMKDKVSHSLHIHGARGRLSELVVEVPPVSRGRSRVRTVSERVPVAQIMSPRVVCAAPDLPLADLLELLVRDRLGCVPVVDDDGRPQGMVTKLDLVTHFAQPALDGVRLTSDIMMPFAISLDHDASVAQAATLLALEDLHHVMIVAGRRLVGVVSTMDITRWLAENAGLPS